MRRFGKNETGTCPHSQSLKGQRMLTLPGQGDNLWWHVFVPVYAPLASLTFQEYVRDAVDVSSTAALPRLARALSAAQAGEDKAAEASVLFYTGAHQLSARRPNDASESFTRSETLWAEVADQSPVIATNHAATLEGLARCYVWLEEYEAALDTRISSRQLLEDVADSVMRAEIIRGMADIYFFGLEYNLTAAAPLYQEARALYQHAENAQRSLALTNRRMALLALLANEAPKATPLLAESISYYHSQKDIEGEAGALALLALARFGLDGPTVARAPAQAALDLLHTAGKNETKAEGWALLVRARCGWESEQQASAQFDIVQAESIFTNHSDALGLRQARAIRKQFGL